MAALLLITTVTSFYPIQLVNAAQITNRSLTLQAGTTDGGSKPSGVVKHKFDFTLPSSTSIGSIQFLYCTTAAGTCTTPSGLSTTSAALGTVSGAFIPTAITNSTNGAPYVSKASATTITPGTVSVQLTTVTNPSAVNQSFYVRISTFGTTNATGAPTDQGTVGASTAQQIILTGTMPESLIFCTGAVISTTAGIPDCSTATSGAINFNQAFSPTDTATATSQMAASTNAASGYSITVNGPTLTSGANTISPLTSNAASTKGVSQFGLNLKLNTTATSTTPVGAEVSPAADGTNLRGQAGVNYNTVDNFRFASGDSVANSANGGAGPTNAQIFTSSYIVNVTGNQASGTYVSTLTYICTATF